MADLNYTIKATGGDYASPVLAEAAIPNDASDRYIFTGIAAELYSLNGFTINPTNANNQQHTFTVGSAYRHTKQPTTGARITDTGGSALITITTNHITISGWNLESKAGIGNEPGVRVNTTTTGNIIIDGNYFYEQASNVFAQVYITSAAAGMVVRNNCFSSNASCNAVMYVTAGATVAFSHNAIAKRTSGTYTYGLRISHASATVTMKGNIVAGSYATSPISVSSGTLVTDYNMVSDGTNKGTHGWDMSGLSLADTDVFTDPANGDLSLKSSFAAYGYLDADNAVSGTTDINGVSWIANVENIGAEQDYPAAPTVDATPAPDATYTVGDAYSVDHAATGTGTLTFDVSAGAVPSGTTLTGATGVVAGTLDTAEEVSYTLRVTDAWSQTGTRVFTTTINAPISGSARGRTGPGISGIMSHRRVPFHKPIGK